MTSTKSGVGVLFAGAVLLVAITTAFTYTVGLRAVRANAKVASQRMVIQTLEETFSAAKDVESGMRGYVITGEEGFLKPYSNAVEQVAAREASLRELAQRNEIPSNSVQYVIAALNHRVAYAAEIISVRRLSFEEAVAQVASGESSNAMDQLRSVVASTLAQEERELKASEDYSRWSVQARNIVFGTGALLNLGFLAWAFRRIVRDLELRQKANDELERQRELLHTTLTSIGDGVIVTDSKGNVNFLNAEAERLTGWSNSEAQGKPLPQIFNIVNEETRKVVESPVEKVLRYGTVVGLANHTILIGKDTRETPIDDSAAPIRGQDGQMHGVVLVFRDFSEHKKAEAAIRESEEWLRVTIKSIGDAVLATDKDGRITLLNPVAAKLTGWEPEEAAGHHFSEVFKIINEATRCPAEDIIARVLREKAVVGLANHTALISRNGQEIPIEDSAAPILDDHGRVLGVVLVFHDVTEQRRLEEESAREKELLRQSEEQFRALAESLPALAWWANADGYLTWYNRRWYEFTGTTPEQMEGWGWKSVHDPEMLPAVVEQWTRSIASRESFEMEFPLRAADGVFRWFLTRAVPVKDAAGNVLRWFGTNTDVTELRLARMVLARDNQELERRVVERTAKLQEAVSELEHFSYTIVHDMRAPLRSMQGFIGIIEEEISTIEPLPSFRYFGRVKNAAERLDRLITDSLDYSRAVREELPLEQVPLERLLRNLLETYPNLDPEKAEITLTEGIPVVIGNPAALTQCFSNLLGNAVKFTKPGCKPVIRVWADRRPYLPINNMADESSFNPPTARSDAGFSGRRVRIWVEDNGIGIPQNLQKRIFGLFQRGSAEYEGTGIGLAIVRKVAERMGGRVGVESEPGSGSRFWVDLRTPE